MVKEIPLTQGQVTVVDDIDFEWLTKDKWFAHYMAHIKDYYAAKNETVCINGIKKRITKNMHRAIIEHILEENREYDLLKEFKENPRKFPVDHINNDSLRNTRANLRIVSNRQNCQNKKYKGKSRFPGVSWDKYMKQWAARIRIKNKRIHLGYFKDEREAAKAYEKANRKYNKEEIVCKIVRGKNYA